MRVAILTWALILCCAAMALSAEVATPTSRPVTADDVAKAASLNEVDLWVWHQAIDEMTGEPKVKSGVRHAFDKYLSRLAELVVKANKDASTAADCLDKVKTAKQEFETAVGKDKETQLGRQVFAITSEYFFLVRVDPDLDGPTVMFKKLNDELHFTDAQVPLMKKLLNDWAQDIDDMTHAHRPENANKPQRWHSGTEMYSSYRAQWRKILTDDQRKKFDDDYGSDARVPATRP